MDNIILIIFILIICAVIFILYMNYSKENSIIINTGHSNGFNNSISIPEYVNSEIEISNKKNLSSNDTFMKNAYSDVNNIDLTFDNQNNEDFETQQNNRNFFMNWNYIEPKIKKTIVY